MTHSTIPSRRVINFAMRFPVIGAPMSDHLKRKRYHGCSWAQFCSLVLTVREEGCPADRIHHSQTRKGRLSRGRGLRSSRSKTTSLLHGLAVYQLMSRHKQSLSQCYEKRDSGKGCSFDEDLPNRLSLRTMYLGYHVDSAVTSPAAYSSILLKR
jgi:hypothetical protein